MTKKIQELTNKIYHEGISKAKTQANQIISEAEEKASEIIKSANLEKTRILEQAKTQSEELKKNTDSEIQLAMRQVISSFKQQITTLITTAQVESSVNGAFKNNEFIKNIILTLIKNWNPQKPEELQLNILLPEKDEKELAAFFKAKAITELNDGINIQFHSDVTNGFKIEPNDGSYIISFSDKDFENYFKGYVKERTKQILFGLSE